MHLWSGSAPNPAEGAYSAPPDPLAEGRGLSGAPPDPLVRGKRFAALSPPPLSAFGFKFWPFCPHKCPPRQTPGYAYAKGNRTSICKLSHLEPSSCSHCSSTACIMHWWCGYTISLLGVSRIQTQTWNEEYLDDGRGRSAAGKYRRIGSSSFILSRFCTEIKYKSDKSLTIGSSSFILSRFCT